ncbi:GDSL-type esterase/lipase family protein [Sorangium sp. So ce1151]|uniref:GDSL-type esterase/lipase family protein n=1 Tax=Sorangium sp. So ce1151 TaxID=3133332 RepID=UPI003F5F1C40
MNRLLGSVSLSLVCGLLACAMDPGVQEDSDSLESGVTSPDGMIDATLALQSQWGSGYCANVTVKNLSRTAATTSWGVVIDLGGSTVANLWSARSTSSGGRLNVTNEVYNGAIAQGGTASWGFCANGSGRPTIVSASSTGGATSSSSSSSASSSSSSSSSSGGGAGGSGGAGGGGAGGGGATTGTGGSSAFSPCPTNGDPCKILPLGDSITDGVGVSGGGGYRIELFRKARAAGQSITFTGSLMNGPATVDGVSFPRKHEGHSGWKINQIAGLVPTPSMQETPHIVLLMAGTNDVTQSDNLATAPQRLGSLLDKIFIAAPDALVVVAKLIPISFNDAAVVAYNNALTPVVQAKASAGKHVVLVDMHTGFPTSELADGVHPNAAGYARMANVWYNAIDDMLP